MLVSVILLDDFSREHIYGTALLKGDYISYEDVRKAAVSLVNKIFDSPEIISHERYRITCILGGAVPYKALFYYKSTENCIEVTC